MASTISLNPKTAAALLEASIGHLQPLHRPPADPEKLAAATAAIEAGQPLPPLKFSLHRVVDGFEVLAAIAALPKPDDCHDPLPVTVDVVDVTPEE